ncbi:TPA: efflux RND transporter periplasmic adaptor subunit [Candidatus Avigastranaerophilus faecigallinarum]|nr:efflux RND transporter periplasmic adaptor subunit [Candidatus Avigastranaerophilus faecigallinarum]
MKKYIIGLVVILIIIVPFVLNKKNGKAQYLSEPIQKRTITQIVEATGTIEPINTVSIGSQVSGRIDEIFVDYNSHVEKGQLLAQIDTSLFKAQLQQSEANINNAKATLQKNKALLDYDTKTYHRYKNLYERNLVSKNDLDEAESAYKSDLAQVAAAKASIMQAEANYATASANMGYTKIVSPVKGIVISKEVEVGQTVAASFQTPTLFTVAEDLTKMQIETSVSEADIGKVAVGQDVNYTLDGYPDLVFTGKVSQVRLSPTTESNVVTYTVIIEVENNEGKLLPGMTANVSIITGKKEDILTVPNVALKFTVAGNTQKYDKKGIWINKKGKPVRINIETGVSDDNYTEIISDKIKEGDLVYTRNLSNAKKKENMRVPRI